MKFILIIFFTVLLIFKQGVCQNIFNKHFDTEDGLPSNEVYDVIEDDEGFIWFATDLGVSKYDGYEFVNYSFDSTMLDNAILKLYKAPDGKIWFISLNGFLAYYNYKEIVPFERNEELKKFLITNGLYTSFNITENDEIYYGIFSVGLVKINENEPIINIFESNFKQPKRIVLQLKDLLLYSIKNNETSKRIEDSLYFRLENGKIFSIPSKKRKYTFFKSIKIAKEQWICSYSNKLFYLDNEGITKICELPKEIICIERGGDNNIIWAGLNDGGGLHKVDLKNLLNNKKVIGNISVSSILINGKNMWCTTTEKGVLFSNNFNNISYLENEAELNSIEDIYLKNDSLIVLFDNGNIYSINNQMTKLIKQIKTIYNLYWLDGHKDDIVIGSANREVAFKMDNNTLTKMYSYENNDLISVIRTRKDSIYIRLYKINAWIHKDSFLDFISNFVGIRFDCSYQIKDEMYFGNKNGLWQLKSNEWINIDVLDNARAMFITSFSNNTLIVGTKSNGLKILNGKEKIRITIKEGLSSNNILHVLVEGDTAWCSTTKGLNKIVFNHSNFKEYTISHTSLNDGLISEYIEKTIPEKDYLWLQTPKGIIQLSKSTFYKTSTNLKLKINSINSSVTNLKNKYTFPHNENNIKINYTGLDFNSNKNLEYHYQMGSVSDEWNVTKNRDVEFLSLQPGNYIFNIYATNSIQKSNVVSFIFIIEHPWWKTWTFIIVEIIFSGLLISLFFWTRSKILIKKITKKEKEKRDKIELQLKALRAQMNPHFMFNSLNSILYYVLENDVDLAAKYLSKFSKLIRLILQNSEDGDVTLKTEKETLLLYLELEQIRLEHKFDFSIECENQLELDEIRIPTLLIQPIVENAVWHGIMKKNGKGSINISFKKDNNNIICTVEDNGIGRKASALKSSQASFQKSLGLTISKERLNLLHNKIRNDIYIKTTDLYTDNKPSGTLVRLIIPLNQN